MPLGHLEIITWFVVRMINESERGDSMAKAAEALSIVQFMDGEEARFEVIQYDHLSGSDNAQLSSLLFHAQQSGMRLKQVRVILNGGEVVTEAGALHFMKGHIRSENKVGGLAGLARRLTTNLLTKETVFRPSYSGAGEIFLEPSFGHFILMRLDGEEMIVDKGMFYCCDATIDVGVASQRNLSSGFYGGEGWFQTRLKGTGVCVLASSVPESEIIRCELHNEKLQVDGNFTLLRKGNISFSVEKSSKTILGSITSGEGLLQTFSGTGEVWLAPTQAIYDRLQAQGLHSLSIAKGSSHSDSKTN
jgi:uncharacterized protein (AIM24 family)